LPELPTTCDVYIGGSRIPDGAAGDRSAPVAVDGLTVRWGRSTSVDQPAPGTCSLKLLDRGGGPTRVDALVALGATLVVQAAVADQPPVIVFSGRITDLEIEWDDGGGGVCEVIAADLLADLANRFVGAEPWPAETLQARASRIMTAVGGAGTAVTVDPRPAGLPVSRLDVDRQAAANLLRELAVSGTAALWVVVPAATAVPTLRIEDPSARSSMRALTQSLPSLLWTITDSASTSAPLDACAVLRDPVRWARSTTDLITRVTVRWLDQSTSPDPTERTVTLVDPTSEANHGARGLSVSTVLASAAAADQAAGVLVAGHRPGESWRVTGLTWDLGATPVTLATRTLAVTLLDNATRIGVPLLVGPLPWWAPAGAQAGVYVEGGNYRYVGGRWVLALAGIPATGVGGSLSYWRTDPSIRYLDIDPAITFLDMIGVGPRGNTGPAWADAPTGRTWQSVPAGTDWSEVTL
jgi:hypothetical protein